jgi:hypothetical protein
LCTLAAALSHYAAIPMAAALGLYSLLRLRGAARRGALCAILTAGVLFAAIWGPFAYRQMASFPAQIGFSRSDPGAPKSNELLTLALLPLRYFSTTQKQTSEIGCLGAVLYILPLLLIRRRPELLFWWMWLAVGVGAVALSDLLRDAHGLYWIRYTLAASPAAYALAALILAHLSGWTRHLVPTVLALSSILALEGAYDPGKPQWREMGQYIDSHFQPGDVLIIGDLDGEYWPARSELVALSFYAHGATVPTAILDRPPSPPLLEQFVSARRIWFFTDGMKGPAGALFPGCNVLDENYIPGVGTMMRIELRPANPTPQPVNVPPAQPNPPSTAREPVALR